MHKTMDDIIIKKMQKTPQANSRIQSYQSSKASNLMLLGSKYNTTERKNNIILKMGLNYNEKICSGQKMKESLKKENLCPTNFQFQLNNPMVEIPKYNEKNMMRSRSQNYLLQENKI